jgi:hypothetical protein
LKKKKREEKHITRDASRKEDLDLNLSHQWGNKRIQKSTTPLQGMDGMVRDEVGGREGNKRTMVMMLRMD